MVQTRSCKPMPNLLSQTSLSFKDSQTVPHITYQRTGGNDQGSKYAGNLGCSLQKRLGSTIYLTNLTSRTVTYPFSSFFLVFTCWLPHRWALMFLLSCWVAKLGWCLTVTARFTTTKSLDQLHTCTLPVANPSPGGLSQCIFVFFVDLVCFSFATWTHLLEQVRTCSQTKVP